MDNQGSTVQPFFFFAENANPPVYAKHKLSNNISFVKNNFTAISVKKSNSRNVITLELQHIEINTSSRARTV